MRAEFFDSDDRRNWAMFALGLVSGLCLSFALTWPTLYLAEWLDIRVDRLNLDSLGLISIYLEIALLIVAIPSGGATLTIAVALLAIKFHRVARNFWCGMVWGAVLNYAIVLVFISFFLRDLSL